IAEHFGYKISVHSGSDKFKIFPVVGDITKGHYHLKTAGTNWLEALRVIASRDEKLFRNIFRFAIDNLETAKAYYHISGNPDSLPPLKEVDDNELINLLNNDDARQDRKSTRLNSSHVSTSYAVFCLKKKSDDE